MQYTNPGAYPPLEHSSRILADAGWKVRFLGTGAYGTDDLAFPPHPNISVHLRRSRSAGWKQKLDYISFGVACLAYCLTWRPKAVYCSDPWSTPIGVLVWYLFRVPVVYHEHDAPGVPSNASLRIVHAMRRRLARVAAVCVVPQQQRLLEFEAQLMPRLAICVWNCPRREEVLTKKEQPPTDSLHLFYVGSLNASLLPETMAQVLAELCDDVELHVVGYETVGSIGYTQRLRQLASDQGVASRVHFYGPLPRREFFRVASGCDVGLCLFSAESGDSNRRFSFGASVKLFDYMACGLAVVVPNQPDWVSHVVECGYGVGCDVSRVETLRLPFKELLSKLPFERRRMGELGRQRILKDWNYETQFEPLQRLLTSL